MSICGCTIDLNTTFYDDSTWELESQFHYYGILEPLLEEGRDLIVVILDANDIPTDILEIPDSLSERSIVEAVFNELVAIYGTKTIAAEWELVRADKAKGTMYEFRASGRNWESFEDLVPGYIQVSEVNPGMLRIEAEFGEINVLASAFLQETVRLHAQEIIETSTNAPVIEGDYAQWPNPDIVIVDFVPKSRAYADVMDTLPWALSGLLLITFLAGLGVLVYRRTH